MSKDFPPAPGPHPAYGKALSGRPNTVEGVIFRPYQRGVCLYSRCSDDFRIEVYRPIRGSTYRALVDGVMLPTKFRSEQRAFLAGIAKAKGP